MAFSWRDMEVVSLPGGAPTLRLTGGAAERLRALIPAGHTAKIHVTLTDDPPMAQAFVIIEALPSSLPSPMADVEPATARVAAPDGMV